LDRALTDIEFAFRLNVTPDGNNFNDCPENQSNTITWTAHSASWTAKIGIPAQLEYALS